MVQRENWKVNKLPEFEKKDIYQSVFLNEYGYYELRQNHTGKLRSTWPSPTGVPAASCAA